MGLSTTTAAPDAKKKKWIIIGILLLAFYLLLCIPTGHRTPSKKQSDRPDRRSDVNKGRKTEGKYDIEDFAQAVFLPGRELAEKMMTHAWEGYKRYAWGQDELCPVSKLGQIDGIAEDTPLGTTIYDSIDTAMLMGMQEVVMEARTFLNAASFDLPGVEVDMARASTQIVGSLLSAFALCGDGKFLEKAIDVAQRFLPNFSPDGYPEAKLSLMRRARLATKQVRDQRELRIKDIVAVCLEFAQLSNIIGDLTYKEKADGILKLLNTTACPKTGLYPDIIRSKNGQGEVYSLNPAYDVLLKYWIITGKRDEKVLGMWKASLETIKSNLLFEKDSSLYVGRLEQGVLVQEMSPESCKFPATLALAALHTGDDSALQLAKNLVQSCHATFFSQDPKTPKIVSLNILPEFTESLFVLWRVTKDPVYRQWGFELARSIQSGHRVESGGYQGNGDRQPSHLLGATLKYLYLLFQREDLVSLEKWVFNFGAHPLPVISP